jgi:exodeoxyribonuclease VII small subunit
MAQKNIQEDFQQLESIINKLENQKVGLEESLKLFEDGSKIIKSCHSQLKKAKNKFEEIKQDLESEIKEN